eukprot:511722_1
MYDAFDDAAFYWFAQILCGIILIPFAAYKINKLTRKQCKSGKYHSLIENIIFLVICIAFLILLKEHSKYVNMELISFDPYFILNIGNKNKKSLNTKQIRKAYKTMHYKYMYWWDNCEFLYLDDPWECTHIWTKELFMLSKAYKMLLIITYHGNSCNYETCWSQYQHLMVTIGLPSWLSQEDNQSIILFIYIGLLISFGVSVCVWWRSF